MKKIITLLTVLLVAATNLLAEEKTDYRVRIEFVDYYDVQHTVWTSERLAEYCSVTLSLDALNKWKDVSKGTPVVVTNFQSDFFSLKGFRCGSTNYYGDTYFNQTVSDENTSNFGDMYLYVVVDALRMQPVATTSNSTFGKAEAARGDMSFEMPLITMDFWDNRFDPEKWYIYYKATPTNIGNFVGWVPEKMITKYGSVESAMSAMGYVKGVAESVEGGTETAEYLVLKSFEEPEFEIDVYLFEEFAKICGVTPSTYYQDLRMRAVFEAKPATVSASSEHAEIYSTTHTSTCTATSIFTCREMTFTVDMNDDITLDVRDIDEGLEFDHWTKDGSNAGSSLPWTFQVTGDVTITAVFKEEVTTPDYYMVFVVSEHGTVYDRNGEELASYQGDPCFYASGTLSLDVKDIENGWEFDYWQVDNVNMGADLPFSLTPDHDYTVVKAVYKEQEVVPPTPAEDRYVIVAQRKADANWYYMTSDLGTASTKRYQAVDAGYADISKVNTKNLDDSYYWEIEEDKHLKNGPDYSTWTSGNSAKFGPAIELTIVNEGSYYTFSFADGANTRYLSLNKTTGNDYFAYYSGTNQAYQLHLIKEGEMATGIEDVQGDKVQSTKVLINGQLFIIRDGKTYNAQGIEMQ